MRSKLPQPLPHEDLLRQIGRVADACEIEAYAVGGMVRDAILGRAIDEIDLVTVGEGSGLRLAEAVAEELEVRPPVRYPNFGTASIRLDRSTSVALLEFVGARRESYRRDSRKPIVETGTLEDDQQRRDFTINALAITLNADAYGKLLDPFDGVRDLKRGILRTPLDPERTFDDDPLRMVRAARFAAELAFRVETRTLLAIGECADRIQIVSPERIEVELQKIISAPKPSIGFDLLYETGLLVHLIPELVELAGVETVGGYAHKDNFRHTLQVLDNVAVLTQDRDPEDARWLRWAALFHDIAKPLTKRFVEGTGWTFHGHDDLGARMIPRLFRKLRLPADDRMKRVQKLVRLHHRPVALVDESVSESAVRRLIFEAGDLLDDLMLLVRADVTSRNPRRVRRYLEQFDLVEEKMAAVEELDRLRSFQPPVDGEEIKSTLGLEEGVAVGIIKERIREAILEGEIPNEHDAAYALMMTIKDDAIRRGRLFEKMLSSLGPAERRAMGAVKARLFHGEIPDNDDDAMKLLKEVVRESLNGTS